MLFIKISQLKLYLLGSAFLPSSFLYSVFTTSEFPVINLSRNSFDVAIPFTIIGMLPPVLACTVDQKLIPSGCGHRSSKLQNNELIFSVTVPLLLALFVAGAGAKSRTSINELNQTGIASPRKETKPFLIWASLTRSDQSSKLFLT